MKFDDYVSKKIPKFSQFILKYNITS